MDILSLVTYAMVASFTPGPNNIISMTRAREQGFSSTLPFIQRSRCRMPSYHAVVQLFQPSSISIPSVHHPGPQCIRMYLHALSGFQNHVEHFFHE